MEITLAPLIPGTPPRGPLPELEVRALLAAGQLAPDTLAWTPGRGEWVPVGALLGTAPPPMPMPMGGNLPPPMTVPPGERRTAPLAIVSLLLGLGVFVSGFLTGIPAIITGHLAQKRIRESHGRLKGHGLALTGLICGYVSLLLIPLLLLSAIAIPGFLRARKRSQANMVLSDARLVDAAMDQFAIEHDKPEGTPVRWEDLTLYLKAGSRLANSGGRDLLGRPYACARTADAKQVTVHPDTVRDFADVIAEPAAFWGDYLPAGAEKLAPPVRRSTPPARRPGTSAVVPRAGPQAFSWNCGCALSAV